MKKSYNYINLSVNSNSGQIAASYMDDLTRQNIIFIIFMDKASKYKRHCEDIYYYYLPGLSN